MSSNIYTDPGAVGTLTVPLTVPVGAGTATVSVGGTYAKFVSGAGVGNGADTTQDALWTLTAIPANTLTANGDTIRLTLEYVTGATANNKAFGVNVGGVAVNTVATTANNQAASGHVLITRVDATHLNVFIEVVPNGTSAVVGAVVNQVVADVTLNTTAIIATGASSVTGAANDVKLFSGVAELLK